METLGTPWAMVHFLAPHFWLPLLIAIWALVFGLLGMFWFWSGVKAYVLWLAIAFTFLGCILSAQSAYANRFRLREQELLARVQRGWKNRFRPGLTPGVALGLTIVLSILLVESAVLWDLTAWLVLEPPSTASIVEVPPLEEGIPRQVIPLEERVTRAFPLMCLIGYVLVPAAFARTSALMLAQEYAGRLNERLPQPIFLRENLLAEVVQREATHAVGKSPGNWTWDQIERGENGGVRLKALEKTGTRTEESLTGDKVERPVYTTYVIEADPWSRITKVAPEEPEGEK
jgi:signal transduction histidine kinase